MIGFWKREVFFYKYGPQILYYVIGFWKSEVFFKEKRVSFCKNLVCNDIVLEITEFTDTFSTFLPFLMSPSIPILELLTATSIEQFYSLRIQKSS